MLEKYLDNYVGVIKKYVVFEGRASRREFWMFVLVNIIISIALSIFDGNFGFHHRGYSLLGSLYSLFVFLPALAVSVRRLHDTSHSGWWMLIAAIPLLGIIVILAFELQDSTPGANKYGPNPNPTPVPVPSSSTV